MQQDFDAELHARPPICFSGPALVENIALVPASGESLKQNNLDLSERPAPGIVVRTQRAVVNVRKALSR